MVGGKYMSTRPGSLSKILLMTICGLFFFVMIRSTQAAGQWVYFGTYTGGSSKGIYVSHLNDDGKLTLPQLAAPVKNPSFLAVDPKKHFLYAISEVTGPTGGKQGDVAAFSIDDSTGLLVPLNQQSSGGETHCHIHVDTAGRTVLVSSYGGGSVTTFPIDADGRLGKAASSIQHHGSSVNPVNQKSPHAHHIVNDPSGRFALVCDLGLDKILVYRLNNMASILDPTAAATAALKPGSGPRHLAFAPGGKFVYVITEMSCEIEAFAFNPQSGSLTPIQTISLLPVGRAFDPGFSGAEVVVHPSGKYLYGSTRGLDLINVYSIDETSGLLTHVEDIPSGGKTPRSFDLDRAGRLLLAANQNSNNVTVFNINLLTGRLTPTGQTLAIGSPCCVAFVPSK